MSLHFDPATHTYTLNGKALDSVTKILKPLSDAMYVGVAQDVMERAALLGQAVHKVIELDILGTLDEDNLDPILHPYLQQWRRFRDTSGFVPLLSETQMHSARYGYAGTPDLFGILDGEAALIDAKRTAMVPRTAGPQTAGYEILVREAFPDVVERAVSGSGAGRVRRFALHLKETQHRLVPFTDPGDQATFLACLRVHNWKKAA